MNKILQRDAAGLVAGLVLIAAVLLGLAAFVWQKHSWAQDRLAEVEPRYARLVGLDANRAQLDAALASTQASIARHVYGPGQDASRAGNDAQQRARDVFSKAGLDVVSTQVLPAKQEDRFDRVPIVVRLEGEVVALQSAMAVLPTLSPSLFVEGMSIQTTGQAKAEVPQRLSVQFNLFVLRQRS
jgi:general secretion pathway protein M